MVFKGANKSTIWYSVQAFKNAGVKPPKTWPELLTAAKTLRASGMPAYSLGGADGWTLTDLFENIYLRQAGAAKYDQLTTHKIKWTDPSVKAALKAMGRSSATPATSTAARARVADRLPDVGHERLQPAGQGRDGHRRRFVPGAATKSKAKPIVNYNQFPFPSVGGSAPSVVGARRHRS